MPKKLSTSSEEKKASRHSEKRFKRKLGKRLLKSVNRGLEKVQKRVKLCKENGVSIDYAHRKTSASALHCAVILGAKDVVEYLLKNEALIDVRDNYGNTPLIYALVHHHPEVAKLLVENGANLHCTNQKGESPLSLGVRDVIAITIDDEPEHEQGQGIDYEKEWRRVEHDDGEEFDWGEHLDAEYSDEESKYSTWRDVEEEYKEKEDDSWMDRIAEQARQKFSQRYRQEQEKAKENIKKEQEYQRLLEEEIQRDKQWRDRVMKAASMNNSELDEKKWIQFADKEPQDIKKSDIPWPSGPLDNILGIKPNLPHTAKKQLVRAGLLRWHPDKFMQKFGNRLAESEKDGILEKVKEVSQSINQYSEKVLSKM